jgi:hypothetical protein
MAKQIIDTGTQGNDGTGDSIRNAFEKVNTNFSELYSVFKNEGSLSFSELADGTIYTRDQIIVANDTGTALVSKSLTNGTGITISQSPTEVVITADSASLSNDAFPQITEPFDTANMPIGRVAYPSQAIVDDFNALWTDRQISTSLGELPVTVQYYNTPRLHSIIQSLPDITIDFSASSSQVKTFTLLLNDAATINFTKLDSYCNPASYYEFDVIVTNTTNQSITWHLNGTSSVLWNEGIAPVPTATANSIDVWTFFTYDGGQTLVGQQKLKDIKTA